MEVRRARPASHARRRACVVAGCMLEGLKVWWYKSSAASWLAAGSAVASVRRGTKERPQRAKFRSATGSRPA